MGATIFETIATGADPAAAYAEAVRRARYDSGHAGYTGTVAEKDGFVFFGRLPAHLDVASLAQLCLDAEGAFAVAPYGTAAEEASTAALAELDRSFAGRGRELAKVYGGTWGPAVCVELAPADGLVRVFGFLGWASC